MKTDKSSLMKYSVAAVSVLIMTGCATSGPKTTKEDLVAAAKSQAYLDQVVYVAVTEKTDKAPCTLTKELEKPVVNQQSGPSKEWKNLVARANTCVAEKNWRGLEAIANVLARNDIDSPWGSYYLSVAAEGNRDFPRAMWMAELAQKKTGGRSGLFLFQRGRILIAMNETARAMVEIRKAVEVEPTLAEGHLYLAEIHQRDFETDQAGAHFSAALKADSRSYRALTGLAEVRLKQEKGEEAAKLYEAAVAQHPHQLRPWVRLAYIYESVQKNSQQALNTYKGLKTKLDSGKLREKPDFDINAKIKSLEQMVAVPAQVSAAVVDQTRSAK